MKTKRAGRLMNPADAARKEARKKEIVRNRNERKWLRESHAKLDKPEEIRDELKELIELEQASTLNKMQRLRKKILQEAYEAALQRKKVGIRIVRHAPMSRPAGSDAAHARPFLCGRPCSSTGGGAQAQG